MTFVEFPLLPMEVILYLLILMWILNLPMKLKALIP